MKKSVVTSIVGDLEGTSAYKVLVLYVISAIGGCMMIVLGIASFLNSRYWMGIAVLLTALVVALNVIYFRRTGNYKAASLFGIAFVGVFFLFLFVTGGAYQTAPLWLYTFPLAASFLIGSRTAALMGFLLLALSLISQLATEVWPFIASYSGEFLIRFVLSYLVVYAYAYLYEWRTEKDRQQLIATNLDLDAKVRRRTTELESVNEALQRNNAELEERVAERTAALSAMNEKLALEIEEHKKTEEALRVSKMAADQANRAKSDFLANMSHELRTPLNHIIGFTELTLDKNFGRLNEVQEEYLSDVLQSSRHLLSLINDILDLTKVETGKMTLDASQVDLRSLLMSSLVMVKEKALKHGITLSAEIDGIPESICADERKLKQILYNLLANAVKFTPDGGKVRLWAGAAETDGQKAPNNSVKISVIDTGIGIAKEDLERVFTPFVQLDGAVNKKSQGTGLGLSLSKKLVEMHGGRIWAESGGEGEGSAFSILLPTRGR